MHGVTLPKVDARRSAAKRAIRTSDTPADLSRPGGRVCNVCTRNEARYCCPRCLASYCSRDCYQTHSTACTEEFSKGHIQRELGVSEETSMQDKAKMLREWREITEKADRTDLLGATDSASHEDGDADSLQALLAAINDGRPIDLSQLSETQLRQLHQYAASIMKIQEPWWDPGSGSAKIGEIDEGAIEEADRNGEDAEVKVVAVSLQSNIPRFREAMRSILENSVPHLRLVTNTAPSPSVIWHVVASLYGYVVMMRYTNMNWLDDPVDAVEALFRSSPAFRSEFRASSAVDVVEACTKHICDYVTPGTDRTPLLNDVQSILSDKYMLTYALLDGWMLASSVASPDPTILRTLELGCTGRMPQPAAVGPLLKNFESEFRSKLKGLPKLAQLAQRKMYYMLCFVKQLIYDESQVLDEVYTSFTRYLAELALIQQQSR